MYFTDQYINETMINSLKNITKKKLAGLILILVIIIAFGFGGFGGGFSTGNQNNIVKIGNKKGGPMPPFFIGATAGSKRQACRTQNNTVRFANRRKKRRSAHSFKTGRTQTA